MKTFKLKYLLGTIISALIAIISFQQDYKYNIAVPIIFGVLFLMSLSLLISDRHTHSVVDEHGKIIAKFGSEKEAMEFANNQARNVRVLMVHIQ